MENVTYDDMDVDFKTVYRFQNHAKELKAGEGGLRFYKVYREGKNVLANLKSNPYFKRMLSKQATAEKWAEGNLLMDNLEAFVQRTPKCPKLKPISLAAFLNIKDQSDFNELGLRLTNIAAIVKAAWQTTWFEFLAAKRPIQNSDPDISFGNIEKLPEDDFVALVVFPGENKIWIIRKKGCQKSIATNLILKAEDNWMTVSEWPWETNKMPKAFGKNTLTPTWKILEI